ncbi:MAG: hypothetical protein ACK4VI_00760 [Alphaproteobacteria bacterium]
MLIAAYVIRSKNDPNGLACNHTTYIIRTIWIGSFFSVVTVGLASLYMVQFLDYVAFAPCAEEIQMRGLNWAAEASFEDAMILVEPCFNSFINDNFNLLLVSGGIAIIPILLYFTVRLVRGISRAAKGYRIADPKIWF